jgi:2'-5' RNA ligase
VQLFVGTWPPPKAHSVLASYPRPTSEGMRWSTPAQWLVILRPLGHLADGIVPELMNALEGELSDVPTAYVSLERPRGGDWLQAPARGLERLVEDVFAATEDIVPVTHPHKRWAAHLVLARGRSRTYEPQPLDVTWMVRSVVLARAIRTSEGPGYETITTFRLGRCRRKGPGVQGSR